MDAVALGTARERHVRHVDDLRLPQGAVRELASPGYGLGLSIVSMIVAQHGGSLQLQSPPPGSSSGLLARIQLPGRDPSADPDAPA